MRRRDDQEYVAFAGAARTRLRRTAYLICGDWELAADLAQEALIRVYVAWPRLDHHGGLHAYARKCVVSASLDWARRRSSGERPTEDAHLDTATTGHEHDVADREALMQALRMLPPRQRACVVLRYLEDLDVAGTARLLGCSEGTVKSQTARALDALRRHIDLRDAVAVREEAPTW